MKWNRDDIDVYLKEKEYVDTVLVPFVPIEWGDEMGRTVVEGRFSDLLGEETERQLKGRVILSPAFSYLKKADLAEKVSSFKSWAEVMLEGGVKHIICIVTDPDFSREDKLDMEAVQIVWFPAIPIDHMDAKHKQDYLDEHVGQIMKKITQAWSSSPAY